MIADCLILGDSIAVGVAQNLPQCEMVAKVGLNTDQMLRRSTHWISDTVIISLGSNDNFPIAIEFDILRKFRKTIDWRPFASKIKIPFLVATGEADELCAVEFTEAFVKALSGPKQLFIYQDSRHSLAGASVSNGPDPRIYQAEWMTRRLAGKTMTNERWYVENSGRVVKSALT